MRRAPGFDMSVPADAVYSTRVRVGPFDDWRTVVYGATYAEAMTAFEHWAAKQHTALEVRRDDGVQVAAG